MFFLQNRLVEVSRTLINLQTDKNDISPNKIKMKIIGDVRNMTFYTVAMDYLKELEDRNKLNTLSSDRVKVRHVLRFAKSKQLRFQEIDEAFLRRFATYLKTKRNLSERSVVNNFIMVRTLFNRAVSLGVVSKKLYPFGKGKIKIKFPETEKIGLTIKEVQRIEGLDNLTSEEEHTRDVWLLSFYLAGVRAADVIKIKWSNIYDSRLHYRMDKNSKLVSLALPQKGLPILEKYVRQKRSEDDFVFPELKDIDISNSKLVFNKTRGSIKKFNHRLRSIAEKAGITKKLTMHIARHSREHSRGRYSGTAVAKALQAFIHNNHNDVPKKLYEQ